jgi:hypothetical protein
MNRLKVLIAASALTLLAAGDATVAAAASGGGGVQAAFGNTVVSTYPDGRTAMLWLKPGGVYEAVGRRRTPSSGTWTVKGDKVCLKQKKPRSAPFAYCTALPNGGVGASWTGKAVTGEKIKIKLVAGIVR